MKNEEKITKMRKRRGIQEGRRRWGRKERRKKKKGDDEVGLRKK